MTPYKERHLQLRSASVSVALCWMNFAAVTGCRAACDANAREVAQAIGQLEQELGRNATETEVAERLGIDIADYRQMLLDTNNSQLFSYDEWREEHGDSIELVTDDHQRENPLQQLLDNNLRQRVMEAIETLPEREKLVLTLYYQEELNLKEIGAVLEVGESRVSQLHSQAIKRLRTKLGKL
ncbi:RNA polymerase sigma factor for flagellar operon [Escherichia coli]|nr:RNA polymerase sigma factor for flagellar operon [Escherichia coli]